MPRKREFARLARLEAQISEDLIYTRHEHNDVVSEWKRKPKPLGKGGMGEVFCEQCVTGHDAGRLRAVKVVRKPNARLDYGRELEAIARFSQPEVPSDRPAMLDHQLTIAPLVSALLREIFWLV